MSSVRAVLVFFAAWGISQGLPAREWSDSTGKFKIEADLLDATAESVQLKKPSGEEVVVPLARLSKPDQEFVERAMQLATAATSVLKRHCYSCHGESGTDEGGLNYVLNVKRLREKGKVVPGVPARSMLLARIEAKEMPPDDASSQPTEAELTTLREWITAGAFGRSTETARSFVSNDAVMEAVAADLAAADERSRVYLRYFTITHLYNAKLADDELDTVRLALSKMLNSLSWDRNIIVPKPIDAASTVFRVDIRDLRWTRELWEILASENPYNVQYSGRTAADVYRLSGTRSPFVRADWFVASASRPPVYYTLLQLPGSIDGLQQQLKVSFSQNVRQDRAARAGFTKSGISVNPRVIERHAIADGSCWVSYDFSGSSGPRNFFNDPLTFEFDGNEVIFDLPNGLQAYLLFDREGKRIDKAPLNIVRDLHSPDAAVVGGLSCLRCHAGGVISKQDEVRKHAAANARIFGAEKLKTIEALYPRSEDFDKQQAEDQQRYRAALAKLGIKRISTGGEPIFNTTRRYSDPLDLPLASAEVGRTPTELLAALERLVSLQRQLGPLRVAGGTIPREVYLEAYGPLVGSQSGVRYLPPEGRIATAVESAAGDAGTPGAVGLDPVGTDVRGGLAHHWRFDEAKSEIARDSIGRVNLSLGGWSGDDPRWVKGKIGNALQFSQPEQMAVLSRDLNYPQLTVVFWLNVQLEKGTNPRILHPWVSINFGYEKGHGVGLFYQVMEPNKPEAGEWIHYAVAIDRVKKHATIYRNGFEVASGKITKEPDGGRWTVGHNQDPRNHGDTLNGIIDELRIYKRVLAPQEVERLASIGAD